MGLIKFSRTPFVCPVCGETLRPEAKSCPECGACERSGWNSQGGGEDLSLPDEDFDYQNFVSQEFGAPPKKTLQQQIWWWVTVAVLAATVLGLVLRSF